jgi:O-antigen/teichoic acid export membrane protein
MRAVIATALRLYLLAGLIATALSVGLAASFTDLFKVPAGEEATVRALVVLVGVALGLSIAFSPATAVLRGLQRFEHYNVVVTFGALLGAVLAVVVLLAGGGLLGLAIAGVASIAGTQVVTLVALRHAGAGDVYGYRGATRDAARRVIRFSGAIFAVQVAGRLSLKADEILIAAFMTVAAVTPYAIARKLRGMAQTLGEQFMAVLFPLAAELDATGDRERLRAAFLAGTRVSLALMVPVGLTLIVLADIVVAAWVGPGFPEATPVLRLLMVAALVDAALWPAGYILQGMGRNRLLALVGVGTAIANIVLSIALIPAFGLVGVALGTLIPATVDALFVVLPFSMRAFSVSPSVLLRECVAPVLVPAIPTAVLLVVVRPFLPANIILLGLACLPAVAVFAIGYLRFGSTYRERRVLADLAGRVRARAG